MKNIILVSVIVILAAPAAYSNTAWSRWGAGQPAYGDPVIFTSARSAAMGNTTIANEESAIALFSNPALLSIASAPRVDFLLSSLYVREDRSFPTYDSYYDKSGESIYVSNAHLYGFPAFAAAFPVKKKLTLAVGYSPVIDYSYNYLEVVRDVSYIKKDENVIQKSGAISAVSLGAAFELSEKIRIGAAFNSTSGRYDDSVSTIPFPSGGGTMPPYIYSQDTVAGLSGSNITAGISYYIRDRLNISLNYRTEMKMSGTSSGSVYTGSRSIQYPSSMGLGIKYQPENVIPVVLSFDAISTAWSKLTDTAFSDTRLQDVIEYHIGLEHRFDKGMPVRLGFAYVPHYTDPEVRDNYLTLGTGFEVNKVSVDLGLVFRKSNYIVKDIFAGYHASKPDSITYDTVIDSTFGMFMGFGYKW